MLQHAGLPGRGCGNHEDSTKRYDSWITASAGDDLSDLLHRRRRLERTGQQNDERRKGRESLRERERETERERESETKREGERVDLANPSFARRTMPILLPSTCRQQAACAVATDNVGQFLR